VLLEEPDPSVAFPASVYEAGDVEICPSAVDATSICPVTIHNLPEAVSDGGFGKLPPEVAVF
jgi:hypothetical protein